MSRTCAWIIGSLSYRRDRGAAGDAAADPGTGSKRAGDGEPVGDARPLEVDPSDLCGSSQIWPLRHSRAHNGEESKSLMDLESLGPRGGCGLRSFRG